MKRFFLYLFCFFFLLQVFAPNYVLAGATENMSLENFLCTVFRYLTGTVGKAIAAFACVGISLGFIAGKLAWPTVLTFAIGMACVFGAPQIVKAFSGGSLACYGVSSIDKS
jgi:type IV secretory pathway VirB2 component (pilin)